MNYKLSNLAWHKNQLPVLWQASRETHIQKPASQCQYVKMENKQNINVQQMKTIYLDVVLGVPIFVA